MKRFLPLAFIFLIACNKESIKRTPNGSVKYTIEGDVIQIADSSSLSVAKLIHSTTPTKGYALQAYYAKPGGEVLYMISFYIITDQKIETGHTYSDGVTGSILRNSTDYASTKDLQNTNINIYVGKQNGLTLTGTFTGILKNLNTNELVGISGEFNNVKIIE